MVTVTENNWSEWARKHSALTAVDLNAEVPVFTANNAPRLTITAPPSRVHIKDLGSRRESATSITVEGSGLSLDLVVSDGVHQVAFAGEKLDQVRIWSSSNAEVSGLCAERIEIGGVDWPKFATRCEFGIADVENDGVVSIVQRVKIDRLRLRGSVRTEGSHPLAATHTDLETKSVAVSCGTSGIQLGSVTNAPNGSLSLEGDAAPGRQLPQLSISDAKRLEVRTKDASLLIVGDASELKIHSPLVTISGTLTRPVFAVSELKLSAGAKVRHAEGIVDSLSTIEPGAFLHGNSQIGILVHRIVECSGARLENVDVTEMSVESLDAIEKAVHFTPLLPPRIARDRRGIRRFRSTRSAEPGQPSADAVDGGDEYRVQNLDPDPASTLEGFYWTRLAHICQTKGANGHAQSQVRHRAARERRRYSGNNRERYLLGLYSLVGYGERIALPLIWLGGLSALVAAKLAGASLTGRLSVGWLRMYAEIWLQTALAPLRFFRVETGLAVDQLELIDQLLLGFVQLIGVVLIFFSLTAIRRVSRAD